MKSKMLEASVDKMCKVLAQFGQLQQTNPDHAARIEILANDAIAVPQHRALSPRKIAPQGNHSGLLLLALTGMKNVMPRQAGFLTGEHILPPQYYERFTEVAAIALQKLEAAANDKGQRLQLKPMFDEIVALAAAAQHTSASSQNQGETVDHLCALGKAIAEHIKNQPPLPPRIDNSVRARLAFTPENKLHPAPEVYDQRPPTPQSTPFADAVQIVRNAAQKVEQSAALKTLAVAQAVIRAATAYLEDAERFGKAALADDANELRTILNPVRLQQSSLHPHIRSDFQGALKAIGIEIASSSSDFNESDDNLLLSSPRRRLFVDTNELLPNPEGFVPASSFRRPRMDLLSPRRDIWIDPRAAALGPPPGTAQRLEPRLSEDQAVDAKRLNDSAKKAREALQITP
jgi:hypothetical protein